jgi:phosphopantetheinyl transferase
MDGLARLCLTGEERRALKRVPGPARTRRFLSFWTAKEARMKLTGEGMRLEPRTIALDLSDGQPVGYRRPRTPAAELRFVRLSRPDAICCVALVRGAGG